MIIKQLQKFTKKHIYSEIRARNYIEGNSHEITPVFFLSTGRCGTKFFTNILRQDKSKTVVHNYVPELIFESKTAYEASQLTNDSLDALLGDIYVLARSQLFWRSKFQKKSIIETNNKITFFAPALAKAFPQAKFIHIYRHPAEFIRSGISRGWYLNHPYDSGRIEPVDENGKRLWVNYSQYQKIAWLWNETNRFIEAATESLTSDRILRINFNQLDESMLKNVVEFAGFKPSTQDLTKHLETPANAQKQHLVPEFSQWDEDTLEAIREITQPLSNQYGYQF